MWLENFIDVNEIVFYVFAAVAALNLVLAFAVLILGCCFRTSTPGSSMDFYISFGGLFMVASVLIRGVQLQWYPMNEENQVDKDVLNILCQVHPSILIVGLIWFIGGLLVKCAAIVHANRVYGGEKPSKVEWMPNLWILFLMVIDVVIVFVWMFRFRPIVRMGASVEQGPYLCSNQNPQGVDEILRAVASGYHAVLLILAAIVVWPAVNYSRGRPSSYDATVLSVIVYNTLLATIAGTIVYFVGRSFDVTVRYAVIGGLMEFVVFAALLLLLIGKVVTARRNDSEGEDLYNEVSDSHKGYE